MDENEEKMTSTSWYDYQLRIGGSSLKNNYYTDNFSKDAIYETDPQKIMSPNSTGSEKPLTDENDATEENGWISPMDYYKNHQAEYNNSRDVSNGMIQDVKDDHNNFIYKDQYWWCEDLHNWCLYTSDCINFEFLNCFYLHVWNGKNAWVPFDWSYHPVGNYQFAPLQNKIIDKKIANGEVIYQTRGRFKFYKDVNHDFGEGPLSVNHAFILKNTDKYSINSDQNFQTIRWSTPRHINTIPEYINFDGVNKLITDAGNIFYFTLRLSDKFGRKNGTDGTGNREKFFANIRYEYIVSDEADSSFWYKVRRCNVTEDSDYSRSYWDWRVDANGILVGEEFDHQGDYENYDKTIWYDNEPSTVPEVSLGSWHHDEWWTDDDKKAYGPEKACHPLNHRAEKYNHIGLCPFAFEKVFALYVYKPDGRPISQTALNWSDTTYNLDTTYDVIKWYDDEGNLNTAFPIYLSYVDILFLFYHTSWSFTRPGGETFNYTTWKKRNSYIVQTLASMFHGSYSKGESFFKLDYTEQKAVVDNLVDSLRIANDGIVSIAWADTLNKNDQTFMANLYAFTDPAKSTYKTKNTNDTTGSTGRKHDPITVNNPPVYFCSWYVGYSKNDNVYKTTVFGDYTVKSGFTSIKDQYLQSIKDFCTYAVEPVFSDYIDETALEMVPARRAILRNGKYQLFNSGGGWVDTWGMGNKCSFIDFMCTNDGVYNYAASNYREGVSTGNPAIIRLSTGEISLSTTMLWAGCYQLLGKNNIEANKFLNNICKDFFGNGQNKTINDHWLKTHITDIDQTSKDSGMVSQRRLQTGYFFEQINTNNSSEDLKIKLSTYRPLITMDTEVENADFAKKW